jgi:hypothetical protein
MISSFRVRLVLAAFVVLAAQPAAAQSIRATARDAVTGAPLAEAIVRAHAANGSVVAAGFADARGVVVLRLRQPGAYRVQVQRAGYDDASVQVEVGGEQVLTEIRLAQRPFALDTVIAMAQLDNERGRQAFERRRSLGLGVFLDSAYLERRVGTVAFAGDLLQGVPGVYVHRRGLGESVPRSDRGWRCMVMLLDGRPVQMQFRDGGRRMLHHMIGPRDVRAVEVYREFSEVPQEFQMYANQGINNCGVYLYWTRARW